MKFTELVVLLPCHSFDDFPMYHKQEAAEGLLAAWSALWHPRLLASAEKTPTWRRVDDPPGDLSGRLVVVPTIVQNELPAGFAARAKAEGATLIRKLHKRTEIVAAALAALDAPDDAATDSSAVHTAQSAPPAPPQLDAELEADFLTLGLCYLQTDLLTRRMRYLSNLDEAFFQSQALSAAKSLLAGDLDASREALRRGFELLAEVRGHYYPLDVALIDLTLVAGTTIGQALRDELSSELPINLLISASVVEQMASEEPATLHQLRTALDAGNAVLVGGEYTESELPLLSPEGILAELKHGLDVYQQYLGLRPMYFARRRFGLTAALPQILSRLGYLGALHFTLDDGRFPDSERTKSRWEGVDGSPLETLSRVPLDANAAESFLSFPEKAGDTMDHDHVAALAFAHWPGAVSPFYRDLRRMAQYGNILGRFTSLANFFDQSDSAGVYAKHLPDQYRSPYLQQAIVRRTPDAISSRVRRAQQQLASSAAQTIDAVATMMGSVAPANPSPHSDDDRSSASIARFIAGLPRDAASRKTGVLVLNPLSYTRRVCVDVSSLATLPEVGGPVLAIGESEGQRYAVVETPSMGYAWVCAADAPMKPARRGPSPGIANENVLRNEFCEIAIHPSSGGIQSVHDLKTRGNRLSQQVALRIPPARSSDDPIYSKMVASSVVATISNPALGEITSRGELLDPDGKKLANYVQRVRLPFGSRVAQVDLEIDLLAELRADPWNSYLCARFAWPDAAVELRRSVQWGLHLTENKRIESPEFVEIKQGELRTSIVAAGLPWHQLAGKRMIDTILSVRGESAQKFRFGIGVDLPQPLHAALELMSPEIVRSGVPAPPLNNWTGWFFHLDVKNVLLTHLEPLIEAGQAVGFRARVLEIAGRSVRARLSGFRAIAAAHTENLAGDKLTDLVIEGERIDLHLGAHEWIGVVARWKI